MSFSPESFTPEWISAIANIFIAFGVVFIAWQAFSAAYQIKADHERSRRQKAIELMEFWCVRSLELLPAMLIREMIEELSFAQCTKISACEKLEVDKRFKSALEAFFGVIPGTHSNKIQEEVGILSLDEYQVRMINRYVAGYLNTFETIATAWRHGVADKDIIEEEFYALFVKGRNRFRLEEYRKASGVFPSIALLVNAIKDKENSSIQKSPIA